MQVDLVISDLKRLIKAGFRLMGLQVSRLPKAKSGREVRKARSGGEDLYIINN